MFNLTWGKNSLHVSPWLSHTKGAEAVFAGGLKWGLHEQEAHALRMQCAQQSHCPTLITGMKDLAATCKAFSRNTHRNISAPQCFWLHFPNTILCLNNQKYVDTDIGTAFTWPPHYKKFSEVLDCFLINVFCLKRRGRS